MTQHLQLLSHFYQAWPYSLHFLLLLLLYFIYRLYFKHITFRCVGSYDQKLKNIGPTIPKFPNGWYVAVRSELLEKGSSQAVDIAGENIVVFRSEKGEAYALEAYCKHLGAHLGVGGKVVNGKCIQCPFHGWLYDGETGACVDYNGKPMEVENVEYNPDFCEKGKKLSWVRKADKTATLRKYPSCEMNGYVYVWIHAMEEHQQQPIYPMLDLKKLTKGFQYRATAIHDVQSHIQDIPQNGADALHFKFVHAQIIENNNMVNFSWKPRWMRGDNPDVKSMFEHQHKYIRDYKQQIYQLLVKDYPYKRFLSIGYIDNYMKIPLLGYKFFVNITIIQLGCSTVFIFLKGPFFTTILFHYLLPKEKFRQLVYHDGHTSTWVPYWLSALVLKMDAVQVASDMAVWDTKRFAHNLHFKQGEQADEYLKEWRQWYSQNYEGCKNKERNGVDW